MNSKSMTALPDGRRVDTGELRRRIADAEAQGLPADEFGVLIADARTALIDELRRDDVRADYARAIRDSGLHPDTLINDAIVAIGNDPQLPFCEIGTVLGATMNAGQLGLRIGVMGQSFLSAYWSKRDRMYKCQLIVGYQGYLTLCFRSELVTAINAEVVYECEEQAGNFEFEWRFEPGNAGARLVHRPDPGIVSRSKEPIHAFYAAALTVGGGYAVTRPWGIKAMHEHRDLYAQRNQRGDFVNLWADPLTFPQMGRKTMLRELCFRSLPKSAQIAHLIAADEGVRSDMSPSLAPGQTTEQEPPDTSVITAETLEEHTLHPADRNA